MDKRSTSSITNILAKFPAPVLFASAPRPKREISDEQAQRILLNQLLVMALESNTRELTKLRVPSKEDKLIGALHHRIDELYGRVFERATPAIGDWMNQISGLVDAAAVSIVTIASENNVEKQAPLAVLLTQLATLAGIHHQDDELLASAREMLPAMGRAIDRVDPPVEHEEGNDLPSELLKRVQ